MMIGDDRKRRNQATSKDMVGHWLNNAGRYPVLPHSQVIHLSRKIQNLEEGDKVRQKAIEKLVRHNLKLIPSQVRKVLRQKTSRSRANHCEEDLLQAGVEGLYRAVLKYDYKRGYCFSTYAVWWIYQQVQRACYESLSPIRVPENTVLEFYKLKIRDSSPQALQDLPKKKRNRYADAVQALDCRSYGLYWCSDGVEEDPLNLAEGVHHDKPLNNTVEEILSLMPELAEERKSMLLDHVVDGKSFTQIAKETTRSVSEVTCQIKKDLRCLRRLLTP